MTIKISFLVTAFILFVIACNTLHEDSIGNESKTFITNDTIPEFRSKVNSNSVASYEKSLDDTLNHWKFAVSVFETKFRFKYILKMKYEELEDQDTLSIPNFGTEPTIEIHKGKDDYNCIVGFLDKKKQFKEYKEVAVKKHQMKLTTLKRYFVGVYKNVIQ